MHQINALNPTPFTKKQFVVVGGPPNWDAYGLPDYFGSPASGVPLSLASSSSGLTTIVKPTEVEALLGDQYFSEAIGRMGPPEMLLHVGGLDPTPFEFTGEITKNNWVSIWEWTAKTSVGYGKVWTTFWHGCEHLEFELCFYAYKQDISKSMEMTLDLGFELKKGIPRVYGREKFHYGNVVSLFSGRILDTQGLRYEGSLIPPPGLFRDLSTVMAAHEGRLFALDPSFSKSWGYFGGKPQGGNYDVRHDMDPDAHRGFILNRRPSDTGDQGGFGLWKFLDSVRDINRFPAQHYAVHQQSRRCVHYLEPDGSLLLAKNHPDWVSWDERTHYHFGVSKDRAYRIGHSNPVGDDWGGEDDQHYSGIAIAQHAQLTGSVASRWECEAKLQHALAKSSWPTAGRAMGRLIFGLLNLMKSPLFPETYHAVQDRLKEWAGGLITEFKSVNGVTNLDLDKNRTYALRIYHDDPHTEIRPFEQILWEDLISAHVPYAVGRLIPDYAKPLRQISLLLVYSLLRYGRGSDGRIGKALKWDGGKVFKDYGSRKVFEPSKNTNYHEWGIPAWELGLVFGRENGIPEMTGMARQSLEAVDKNYYNRDSYRGAIHGTEG